MSHEQHIVALDVYGTPALTSPRPPAHSRSTSGAQTATGRTARNSLDRKAVGGRVTAPPSGGSQEVLARMRKWYHLAVPWFLCTYTGKHADMNTQLTDTRVHKSICVDYTELYILEFISVPILDPEICSRQWIMRIQENTLVEQSLVNPPSISLACGFGSSCTGACFTSRLKRWSQCRKTWDYNSCR